VFTTEEERLFEQVTAVLAGTDTSQCGDLLGLMLKVDSLMRSQLEGASAEGVMTVSRTLSLVFGLGVIAGKRLSGPRLTLVVGGREEDKG